jgi:ATP synthase I chain
MEAETGQAADLARAEARLPSWMAAVALAGTLAALAVGRGRVAVGFGLGAAVAILNYQWLHQAVVKLLGMGETRVPKRVVLKFAVRYPLAFAGVYLFYRTGWLPFGAVLAGLFVPASGVLIEAVIQVREGLRAS